MTIAVAKDVEGFLKKQVREGNCADPNKLVNDVLRSLRDQQPFDITPDLEAWLLESAQRPTTPLTRGDFQAIRKRVRARTRSRRA